MVRFPPDIERAELIGLLDTHGSEVASDFAARLGDGLPFTFDAEMTRPATVVADQLSDLPTRFRNRRFQHVALQPAIEALRALGPTPVATAHLGPSPIQFAPEGTAHHDAYVITTDQLRRVIACYSTIVLPDYRRPP